jgi:peptide/nickel transport system substrate-binding protein
MRHALLAGAVALALSASAALAADLRIGLAEDPDALDPTTGRTLAGRVVFAAMCDKLFDTTPDLKIVPMLASSYAWSEDKKSLTLTLKPGVKFQDGEKLYAAAVKYSLMRHLTLPGSARKVEISAIASIDVVGDLTVKLNLSAPFAPLIAQLSDRAGMILSPRAVEAAGDKFSQHPVCAGPFRFGERLAQDRIVLERDPNNAESDIHLDRVIYRPMPDSTVRLSNLRSGDLDVVERVAPTDVPTVREDKRLKLAAATELGWTGIIFNVANGKRAETPIGKDPRVREAFELSLDREAINQVVFNGAFEPGNQWVSPKNPYYIESLPIPKRDVAKAKALLAAAGVPHPALTLLVANAPEYTQLGQVIQSMAQEAGFEVKIEASEAVAAIQAQDRGDFDASINFWSGRIDPDGNIAIWLACSAGLNTGHYCNKDFERLLGEARLTDVMAERKKTYAAAAEIALKDRPILWLYHRQLFFGLSAKLAGFVPHPDGLVRVRGLKIE